MRWRLRLLKSLTVGGNGHTCFGTAPRIRTGRGPRRLALSRTRSVVKDLSLGEANPNDDVQERCTLVN